MFHGAHLLFYTRDAEADRVFFRDVLEFPSVDAGHGWLLFRLPPAESAFHPSDGEPGPRAELYLMCEDLDATLAALAAKGVACEPARDERWGRVSRLTLPSGGMLGFYQPRHPTALTL